MRKQALMIATIVLITAASGAAEAGRIQWLKLPSIPDQVGRAGMFAGVSKGALLVGGGANFPGKMPWEGGRKMWHDTVYVLSKTNGAWREAGKLPQPLADGI